MSDNFEQNWIDKFPEYPDDRFNIGYPPDYKPQSSSSNQQNANTGRQCPREFFSFRSGQFDRAVNDCINILLRPTNDINILGSWLLTEWVFKF